MAIERTFSIIKPDATARNLTGAINAMIEQSGLRIVAQKRLRITRAQAETFYAVHRSRPFFARYRDLMGATDPAKAAPGTIRKVHAASIGENSVHGSDSAETAAQEIGQFFGIDARPGHGGLRAAACRGPHFSQGTSGGRTACPRSVPALPEVRTAAERGIAAAKLQQSA